MSMRTLLSEVRTALTSYSDLTDLIPAEKITLARRPQRDEMPGITFAIGTVDYDPTFESFSAATTYRIDTTIYGRSADQVTQIHDQVKLALANVSSSVFSCRVSDERYMVDVDNNHMAEVQSMWLLDAGIQEGVATLISPALQGYDHMKIEYNHRVQTGSKTVLDTKKQNYFFDFTTSQGQGSHGVEFPNAKDNEGKIYTIIAGVNVDNNTIIQLRATGDDTVENGASYDMSRAHSCATLVAVKTSANDDPDLEEYGWRIVSYHGLHD